jgi:hypothetical protein
MIKKIFLIFWNIFKQIVSFLRAVLFILAKLRQCILFAIVPWLFFGVFLKIFVFKAQLQFTFLNQSGGYLEVILILILLILIFHFECMMIIKSKTLMRSLIKVPFTITGALLSGSFIRNIYFYNIYFIADPLLCNPIFY